MGRSFQAAAAIRHEVPLLIGLAGASGSGKTFSALRLATGMARVVGGEIYVIDTESNRALHYAEDFRFQHVPFAAPFGALDYLEALTFCRERGAKIIVIDSMSHEHESVGGLLDQWENEIIRMGGDDYAKRERVKLSAIRKPKADRRKLIQFILQMNCLLIFCFRAKEIVKPGKNRQGKMEIVDYGFTPVAGDDFLYELSACCLLAPRSGGVPQWASDRPGERATMKLPRQFETVFLESRALDEEIGEKLARWASGAPAGDPELLARGDAAAAAGMAALRAFWGGLLPKQKTEIGGETKLAFWKGVAEYADASRGG
jgi:hypothetical protein